MKLFSRTSPLVVMAMFAVVPLAYSADSGTSSDSPDLGEIPPLEAEPPTAPPVTEVPKESQTPQAVEATPPPSETTVTELPPPEATSSFTDTDNRSDAQVSGRKVRPYELSIPTASVSITGSVKALGGDTPAGAGNAGNASAFAIQIEYQPAAIQKAGVVSFGPRFSVYPLSTDPTTGATVSTSAMSIWSVGGEARYQARYVSEQLLVPYAGLFLEHVFYHLASGSGNFAINGYTLGLAFLLNQLEPRQAEELFNQTHISRSYLFAELRNTVGNSEALDVTGNSLFFGIRMEF